MSTACGLVLELLGQGSWGNVWSIVPGNVTECSRHRRLWYCNIQGCSRGSNRASEKHLSTCNKGHTMLRWRLTHPEVHCCAASRPVMACTPATRVASKAFRARIPYCWCLQGTNCLERPVIAPILPRLHAFAPHASSNFGIRAPSKQKACDEDGAGAALAGQDFPYHGARHVSRTLRTTRVDRATAYMLACI